MDPTKLRSSALAYARAGWSVFPLVRGGKTPATRNGYKDATTDTGLVDRWWAKNPEANIGVACGASGLVVVDVDPGHGGVDTLWQLIRAGWDFPPTLSQVTPSGGVHYVYRATVALRNTAGKLPGMPDPTPGIDLRAQGGYIVVPPSATPEGSYEWLANWDDEPVDAPYWLQPEQPRSRTLDLATVLDTPQSSSRYADAALDGECEAVRNAPVGTRNHQLNESTFKLFTLVATGALDESTVITRLGYAAAAAGLGDREIRATMRSAAEAGRTHPRKMAV